MSQQENSTKNNAKTTSFYYADGKKIELNLVSDKIAVQADELQGDSVWSSARDTAESLMGGYSLIDVRSLEPVVVQKGLESGQAQPVYEAEGCLIVVLPEIRIEESRSPATVASVRKYLEDHCDEILVQELEQRFTLKLKSNRGDAALNMANEIVQQVAPEMAQARFIRLMKRPSILNPEG